MIRRLIPSLLLAAGLSSAALAQQDAAPSQPMDEQAQQAMMEAYIKANSPNENHARLKNLVGDWTVVTRAWMDPSAEPFEMHGTVSKSWTLDGRFLKEELSAEYIVGPYTGVGYLGFDNAAKSYQGVWLSSMSTGIISYTGSIDEEGKLLTCTGVENDAMTGQALNFKMTLTLDNPDTHTLTFWYDIPGAGEVKAFEMTHTRAN